MINGKEISILVKGNKKSRIIAQYHSAVGQALDKNNPAPLQRFKKRRIKDTDGTFHTFETDVEKIQIILLQKEEPEFQTIYMESS